MASRRLKGGSKQRHFGETLRFIFFEEENSGGHGRPANMSLAGIAGGL
jgi:hypothetical protein